MDLATLKERQGWILEQKIDHAVGAVEQFKARTGRPLYVSFSGGKDSTVLLDLCRRFLDPEQTVQTRQEVSSCTEETQPEGTRPTGFWHRIRSNPHRKRKPH